MTPEKDGTIKSTGLEGETRDPWQKARELRNAVEERQGNVVENPQSKMEFYAHPDWISISLYDFIEYHYSLGRYGKASHTCFNSPLEARLVLDTHGQSHIITEVRSPQDQRCFSRLVYTPDECWKPGYSSIPCKDYENIEVASRQVIEKLPFDYEMPPYIDFEATMGQICDIALRIVRDSKENPELKSEDVEALKAVVFGQAIKH